MRTSLFLAFVLMATTSWAAAPCNKVVSASGTPRKKEGFFGGRTGQYAGMVVGLSFLYNLAGELRKDLAPADLQPAYQANTRLGAIGNGAGALVSSVGHAAILTPRTSFRLLKGVVVEVPLFTGTVTSAVLFPESTLNGLDLLKGSDPYRWYLEGTEWIDRQLTFTGP